MTDSKNKSYFIIFNKELSIQKVLSKLSALLNSNSVEKIFFDSKGFLKLLSKYYPTVCENFFDISICEYLLDPDANRNLTA